MKWTILVVVPCGCVALAMSCGPDDNVRFGQPNILAIEDPITQEACTCAAPEVGEAACPTFVGEIYAIIERTCQGGACHDPAGANSSPPLIPMDDAVAAYESLRAHAPSDRTLPYIDPAGGDAYILCSADGDDFECFGAQMPPGGFVAADRALMAAWVACGMPLEETP